MNSTDNKSTAAQKSKKSAASREVPHKGKSPPPQGIRPRDGKIIQGDAGKADPEIFKDRLGLAVISVAQHILVAVVEHGPADLVGHGHKIHHIDEQRQLRGQILTQLYRRFPAGEGKRRARGKQGPRCGEPIVYRFYQLPPVPGKEQGVQIEYPRRGFELFSWARGTAASLSAFPPLSQRWRRTRT